MTGTRVLIVEDEALIAMDLQDQLERRGYEVCGLAASCEEAVRQAEAGRPHVVLMDFRLIGKADGVDAALEIRARRTADAVIFVTGSREAATVERIRTSDPADLLFKPVTGAEVDRAIRSALAA